MTTCLTATLDSQAETDQNTWHSYRIDHADNHPGLQMDRHDVDRLHIAHLSPEPEIQRGERQNLVGQNNSGCHI